MALGAAMKIAAPIVWWRTVSFYICRPNSDPRVRNGVKRSVLFLVVQANVAQLVEQLICNQPVGGSSPFIGSMSRSKGEIPKWPTGADCKSAASQLRRFESCSPHHSFGALSRRFQAGSSNAGRRSQDRHHAGVAQLVEHQPSKLNVAGSSLVSRSTIAKLRYGSESGELSSKEEGILRNRPL